MSGSFLKTIGTLGVACVMTVGIAMLVAAHDGTTLIPKPIEPVDLAHPYGGALETKSFHIGAASQVLFSVQTGRYGSKYGYVRLVETDDAVLLNGYGGASYVCENLLPFVQKNRLGERNLREMDRKLIAYRGQTVSANVLVPKFDQAPPLCGDMRWDSASKELYLGNKAVYFFAPSGKGYAGTLESWTGSDSQ
jgi:hypothetical protein